MSTFMLLLHENPADYADVSPAEMQAIIARYMAWTQGLYEQGRVINSNKLTDEGGKSVRREHGALVVVDGPYAEAREVISGYFVISAASYDEAVDIAKTCPHVEGNGRIEVREIHALG